jgi:hypothetical protein
MPLDRRSWLLTVLGACACPTAWADDKDDKVEEKAVQTQARKARIGTLKVSSTQHYLALGDARGTFRADALRLCEALAEDYLPHFEKKGFAVHAPKGRLTLVILSDAPAFARFLGAKPGADVTGIYDLDTNRLVMFDNRPAGGAKAKRANSISLFHEATHQLTFNTGLLDRQGDVPLCISEGLAMYGEVRRPGGDVKVGAINEDRLPILRDPLLPCTRLFDDAPFDAPMSQQMAYAQSWLLIHFLMNSADRLPTFRDYIKAIRERRAPESRLDDAKKAFGDLDKLDEELAGYAKKLLNP